MLYSQVPMHIPDGFLSILVSLIFWILTILIVAYSISKVGMELGERQAPLMGVLAAAIFAGQMLNFTVVGGTSGHLMGAALSTIMIGPWAAILVMTSVVSIQAIIFQDGGMLALGSNIFNMGVIGVVVSYTIFRTVIRLIGNRSWGIYVGGFLAAWFSIEIAALAVGMQLALSGTLPANIAIPSMGIIHALIGIGEGLITVGAIAFIYSARKEYLHVGNGMVEDGKFVWIAGLLITLLLAVLSPLASTYPDGLEWVAEQEGFLNAAQAPSFSIVPDYVFPGFSNEALATIIAGIFGSLLVLGVTVGVAFWRRTKNQS